jgi:hypothetical protein
MDMARSGHGNGGRGLRGGNRRGRDVDQLAMSVARDLKLCRVAKKHGAKSTLRTLREARRNDIPFSWLLAMIEQESGWQNIFGCDHGPGNAYCHQKVTNQKVRHLLNAQTYNGVGYTQLTSPGYVERAMRRTGGAASVRNQIIVGAQVLKEKTGGDMNRAWRYNGAREYQRQIEAKAERWHQRFINAGLT